MRCSRLVLCLFLLFNLPLFLPLGKLPLPFLTLEKRLYFREQDTGPGFHFTTEYPALFQTVCAMNPPNLSAASICIFMVAWV